MNTGESINRDAETRETKKQLLTTQGIISDNLYYKYL